MESNLGVSCKIKRARGLYLELSEIKDWTWEKDAAMHACVAFISEHGLSV